MENPKRAAGITVLVGVLCLAAGASAFAEGSRYQPWSDEPSAGPPTATSASPSFSLEVRVTSNQVRAPSCRAGRALVGAGPNLLLKGTFTPLDNECLACCVENYIFADGFESGNTNLWSAAVGK